MLKKHMAACLVASAFITMPVLAQTSTSPGSSPPATSATTTGAPTSGAAGTGGAGRFITEQQASQWRTSRLIGLDVYGADNQKIGDINDVLVDRQGSAQAVVVGVGGFLGIGEKNVALPFNAFEWQMDDSARRTASASGSGSGSGAGSASGPARTGTDGPAATAGAGSGTPGTASTSGTPGTTATTGAGTGAAGSPASRTDTTASTSAAGGGSASGARSGAERGYPDHAVLRMSKADLENAPTFRYVGENRSDSGSGAARTGGSSTGTGASGSGTAPRQ
jgi:hypothetical protein